MRHKDSTSGPKRTALFARRSGVYWASASGTTWEKVAREVPPLLTEAFKAFTAWCERAEPELDRIRVFVRFDGGRFGLVAVDKSKDAIEGAPVYWVSVPTLEKLYYELPNPEDGAFDAAHRKMERQFTAQLRKWLAARSASAAIAALGRCRRFRITLIDYDDRETERTILRP